MVTGEKASSNTIGGCRAVAARAPTQSYCRRLLHHNRHGCRTLRLAITVILPLRANNHGTRFRSSVTRPCPARTRPLDPRRMEAWENCRAPVWCAIVESQGHLPQHGAFFQRLLERCERGVCRWPRGNAYPARHVVRLGVRLEYRRNSSLLVLLTNSRWQAHLSDAGFRRVAST